MPILIPLLETLSAGIALVELVGGIVISTVVVYGLIIRIIGLVRGIGKGH